MKNFVRGGVLLSVVGLFVAFIYAQSATEVVLSSANESQLQLNNSISVLDTNIVSEEPVKTEVSEVEEIEFPAIDGPEQQDQIKGQDKNKIIEKTVSSKAVGASRGVFTATAYCLKGRTAMGHGVRRGIIAADPRVLPLGSRISISGGYAGTYLVSDTGGNVKGRKLDIWMPSCAEARRFGRRSVAVNFLGK